MSKLSRDPLKLAPADLSGWIEVRRGGDWYAIIQIGLLLPLKDTYGCLFGVANLGNFRPLFPSRGIPRDASDVVQEEVARGHRDLFGHSWATLQELRSIDWDEEALDLDERVSVYEVEEDGSLRWLSKALSLGHHEHEMKRARVEPEVRAGELLFRRERMRRRDAIKDTDYELMCSLMEVLADRFGSENVRIVVYFD